MFRALFSLFSFIKLIAVRQFSCFFWVRKFLVRGMLALFGVWCSRTSYWDRSFAFLWGFDSLRCVLSHSVCFLCLVSWPLRINSDFSFCSSCGGRKDLYNFSLHVAFFASLLSNSSFLRGELVWRGLSWLFAPRPAPRGWSLSVSVKSREV